MGADHDQPVATGDIAPDFRLLDQDGNFVSLSDFRGRSTVVLFFYPRDYSPICTLEMIAFRDSYDDFRNCGAEILGISSDPPQSHASFCMSMKAPFRLLTDPDHKVLKAYGAHSILGGAMSRVTYVIDREGVVRSIYQSALRAKKHVASALEVAQTLHDTPLDFMHRT